MRSNPEKMRANWLQHYQDFLNIGRIVLRKIRYVLRLKGKPIHSWLKKYCIKMVLQSKILEQSCLL
jgi:hypothetical protein